jgi:hypothetical protein
MDPVLDIVGRAAIGLLLAAAAAHKLRDLDRFRATLAAYALLPAAVAPAFAAAIPCIEALIAVGCVASATRVPALLGAAALLLVYAGALATNLARGRDQLDCGCLGAAGRTRISWWLVARNFVVAAGALAAAAPVVPRPLVWVDHVTTFGAVAVAVLAWVAADELLANLPRIARLRSDV